MYSTNRWKGLFKRFEKGFINYIFDKALGSKIYNKLIW